jgi:hypothetical protein
MGSFSRKTIERVDPKLPALGLSNTDMATDPGVAASLSQCSTGCSDVCHGIGGHV